MYNMKEIVFLPNYINNITYLQGRKALRVLRTWQMIIILFIFIVLNPRCEGIVDVCTCTAYLLHSS